MSDQKPNVIADFVGKVMAVILERVIKNWDYKAWLTKYGKQLVTQLMDQIDLDGLDDKLQDELLDPIKKKLEKMFPGLNL